MKVETVLKAANFLLGPGAEFELINIAEAMEASYLEGFQDGWDRRAEYDDTRGHTLSPQSTTIDSKYAAQPSDHCYDELGY